MEEFLMRSLLFVPGHNDKLMKSASKISADVLIFDIEDSVQPLLNKQLARDKILDFINEGYFKRFYCLFNWLNFSMFLLNFYHKYNQFKQFQV